MKRVLAMLLMMLLLAGCANPFEKKQLPADPTTAPEVTTVATTAPEETTVATTMPEETTLPKETDPVAGMYQDLVEDYRAILAYRLSSKYDSGEVDSKCLSQLSDTMQQIFAKDQDSKDILEGLIDELPMSQYQQNEADYGYILHDVNADGVPELFWVREDHSIAAIFTRKKEEMILLDGFWSRYRGYISENNAFYTHGSSGAADNECAVYSLEGSKLKEQFRFGLEDGAPFEAVGKEHISISADRLNELYDQFPDAPSAFWRSLEIRPLGRELLPEDTDGSTTQKPSTKSQRLPFLRKIRRIDQWLYRGPGFVYSSLGNMGESGTYTILAVVTDADGTDWGKLKSGDGWVNLAQLELEVPIITVADVDKRLLSGGNYAHQVLSADEYTQQVAICAHKEIRDVAFYSLDVSEDYVADGLLFTMTKVKAGSFILLDISFPGDMTTYGLRFTDKDGKSYSYLLEDSGYHGIVLFEEKFES